MNKGLAMIGSSSIGGGPGVTKTCPGNSLDKAVMLSEAKVFKGDLENLKETGEINMALRKGDKGSQGTKLQEDLIALGYGTLMEPYGADGAMVRLQRGL